MTKIVQISATDNEKVFALTASGKVFLCEHHKAGLWQKSEVITKEEFLKLDETDNDDRITETLAAIEEEANVKVRTPFRLAHLSETLKYLCEKT